jgi:NAD(P)-dependent dehydrogenase (short-subunit alcohol dehydrogenase family)
MTQLSGTTAVVTGAGSGLGRTIALRLAVHGARVIGVGRNRDSLDATRREIGGSQFRSAVADVADPVAVGELVGELADEQIGILVNNAGTGGPVAPLVEIELGDWEQTIRTNLTSVFLMCRAFAPQMAMAGRGHIVNIASVAAKRPLAGRSPY